MKKSTASPSLTTTTRIFEVSLEFVYLICLAATIAAAIETNEENEIAPIEVGSNHILITSMQMEFRALIVRD